MKNIIIARKSEQKILHSLLNSKAPEFLAVYGRRRVGKTYLIKEFFSEQSHFFELSGEKDASLIEQLQNFKFSLRQLFPEEVLPEMKTWREALQYLALILDRVWGDEKTVLFFDELPWLASRNSKFLQALDHFWNSWASRRSHIKVVVCGSAASWMIKNIVHNKGGLYNRITQTIRLMPFDLSETEEYLKNLGITLNRKDLLELYMCVGGIPHYLRHLKKGYSIAQSIDALCFSKEGILNQEFKYLFASIFDDSEIHLSIVKTLASQRKSIGRNDLLGKAQLQSGGGTTRALDELVESGFIAQDIPFDKVNRGQQYRLIDEYCLFYLCWIENNSGKGNWLSLRNSPRWMAWSGYSFESLCLKHIDQIKDALGISGVQTIQSSWIGSTGQEAVQVDLVIDRADNCINVCEIKFSNSTFTINKAYAENLRRKVSIFQDSTKTKKNIFLTIITTHALKDNTYAQELVSSSLTMDCLFSKT